jgi:hypothetical protein
MHVLRFSSPRIDDGIPLWRSLSLAADRIAAVIGGREVRLLDLRSPGTPLLAVPDVVANALSESCLIVQRLDGEVHRFEARGGRWLLVVMLRLPAVPEAEAPYWRDLLLSPSGRFLLVEPGPIATGPRTWAVSRAFLIDARSGEPKRVFNLGKIVMRANFAVLPSGDEALFISADSYMSVQ